MPISSLYLISLIISFVIFIYVVILQKEKSDSVFSFLFLLLVIIHFGYYSLSRSSNLQEAILAYKVTFLDSTVLPCVILFCIFKICSIKQKIVSFIFSTLSILTYILGLTAGNLNIFYKDIAFFQENGYSYITRGYGPLHILEPIAVAFMVVISLVIVGYTASHRNTVSYTVSSFSAALLFVNIVTYLIQSKTGITVELLPFAYNFLEVAFFFIVKKYISLDLGRDAYISKNILQEYGFFAFDMKGNFIGCDDAARLYFPELKNLKIDLKIKDEFILHEFVTWENYETEDGVTFKHFKRNDKDIKCTRRPMYSDSTGRMFGYVVEFEDDTEHMNNLNSLKNMNDELSLAVEAAKKANQAKDIFLSRMSHEIRTPINAIIGMDEIIIRETQDASIRHHAKVIGDSAKMLLSLINDLLDFSKIEAGKMELVEDEYNQIDVIGNAIQMVQQRATNKDLSLSVHIIDNLPARLWGDQLKLQQILINLLTNAIKYTEEGSVVLEVSTEKIEKNETCDKPKAYIKYSVTDTGIGIKQSDIEKLFDEFTRINLKRNNHIEGTGLGLAIVNNYVSLMGGTIDVQSIEGKGSVFTVILPQEVINEDTICQATFDNNLMQETSLGENRILTAPNCKVLLVDDNDTNREVFKLLLHPSGMHITEASSGMQAIDILTHNADYNMIFLDHMMPEMDGIETLNAIRSKKLVSEKTPIIALTANATGDAKAMYLATGFTDYVPKPVQVEQLENMIFKYLPEGMAEYCEVDTDEIVDLPELDEFDFAYAIKNLGSGALVKQVALNVYNSLPKQKQSIEDIFAHINNQGAIDKYRIEVHTLKSNAASIGALLLSKLCRVGEVAAIEHNVDKIKAVTPLILDEIDKHHERLSVFDVQTKHEPLQEQLTDEAIESSLRDIINNLEDWNYDDSEDIINNLLNHDIDNIWRARLEQVRTDILDINATAAIDYIKQIIM